MNVLFIVIGLSVLVALITAALMMYYMREQLSVKRRIGAITSIQINNETIGKKKKVKVSINFDRAFIKVKLIKRLANELLISGVMMRPEEFIILWIALSVVPSGLVMLISGEIIISLSLVLIGAFLPPFLVNMAKAKRLALFDKQLGDALLIIGNCLRAGLSFHQAIESIAREMPEPVSKEFARALREIKLGNTMEKALSNMVDRVNSKDFMLIVSAVLIQRQVGGNLSEILENIAVTIKERLRLKGEIKVLTATGRTSGIIVGLLPVFIALFLMLTNPGYIKLFFETPLGMVMLVIAAVMELIGFIVVRKVVSIKY